MTAIPADRPGLRAFLALAAATSAFGGAVRARAATDSRAPLIKLSSLANRHSEGAGFCPPISVDSIPLGYASPRLIDCDRARLDHRLNRDGLDRWQMALVQPVREEALPDGAIHARMSPVNGIPFDDAATSVTQAVGEVRERSTGREALTPEHSFEAAGCAAEFAVLAGTQSLRHIDRCAPN